ncbi:MAG: hypothetical protein GX226_06540 [Dehalococcoidales bacterium]|jgi:hypothetical protein|nr:hypothetical protein [Dehalococcoidales bacterium]
MVKMYKPVKVPKAIAKMLYADETVVAKIRQSRLKRLFTPDSIFVTNHRVILYAPQAMGLRKTIEDYRYEDMANFKAERGILFSTIIITQRFMGNDLVLTALPKGKADNIARIIHEGIRFYSNNPNPQTGYTPQAGQATDDPLKVLQLRYARGEINQQQYEEMRKTLE